MTMVGAAPSRTLPAPLLGVAAASLLASRALLVFVLLGATLVALLALISFLSPVFTQEHIPAWDDTVIFVVLLSCAGAVFAAASALAPHVTSTRRVLAGLMLVGLIGRLVFFGSTPIYEDDWRRYLWDGAVVSEGINPYAATPAQAMLQDLDGTTSAPSDNHTIARLQAIGATHPEYPELINYPYVTTIYPSVALGAFGAAHLLSPFDLDAFRLMLLLSDAITAGLLMLLLKRYGRSPLWSILYLWNPIVIVTGFNAGHMDILLAPFLLAALWLAESRRPRLAAIALAAAAGVKLWPVVLAPVILRAWRKDLKEIFATGTTFLIALAVCIGPLILSLQSPHSGLGAYASEWITNSFLFTYGSAGLSLFLENGDRYLRLAVAGAVGFAALWFTFSRRGNATPMPTAILLTTLMLFFLSPTGYPWYAAWFFLLAPFAPMAGVTLLALTLPIYYLRFLMSVDGLNAAFNYGLTPIEFAIPLVVLVYELRKNPPWRL